MRNHWAWGWACELFGAACAALAFALLALAVLL